MPQHTPPPARRQLTPSPRFLFAICDAAKRVAGTVDYIDTAQFWSRRKYAQSIMNELWIRNGAFHKVAQQATRNGVGYFFTLHRPSAAALAFLQQTDSSHTISRLDVARDFITAGTEDAYRLHHFLACHLVQAYRQPGHRCVDVGERDTATTYFRDKRKSRRNLALYSDRPSKVTGDPCCHMEFRARRAATVRTMFRIAGQAEDMLRGIDLDRVVAENCSLAHLDRAAATETLERIAASGPWRFPRLIAEEYGITLDRDWKVADIVRQLTPQGWLDATRDYRRGWMPRHRHVTKLPVSVFFDRTPGPVTLLKDMEPT